MAPAKKASFRSPHIFRQSHRADQGKPENNLQHIEK
jgi:hypothetical protein